jgi:beta-carotene 3-hydroxylase
MSVIIFLGVVILTFFAMEGITWLTHKYVMHGFLWYLHEDHHQPSPGFFEKNDAFFLIFAIPSWLCIMLGLQNELYWIAGIGFGIALYGFAYFIVHEVIIHQRFKLFRNANNKYARALRRAHKMHHKHIGKHQGECFGMLLFPFKHYKNA